MSAPAAKPVATRGALSFGELDKVRLTRAITAKGKRLAPGRRGTIVYCHGTKAYEVEFPGIHDFFQIPAEYLEKI